MTDSAVGHRRTFDRLSGGGYVFSLVDEGVEVQLRYLRRERGQLHAEVDVLCDWAGARRHGNSLSCADLNLSSQPARRGLASYCAERARTKAEDFDWHGVIDAACLLTIQAERQGDDVIVLDDAPTVADYDVDILGLKVPTDAASILIAHGDSLKSLTTLLILGTLAQRGQRALYVDWEWTAERHKLRKVQLFGPERLDTLRYLKCKAPLTLEVDRIRRYCDEHRIEMLGIDSIGLAADGKLIDDDVAIRFHRALGTLPPAVCAAHVPKSAVSADPKADPIGPFGSVFFSNLCRASWLVKKQPSSSDDVVTVGLFPQKQNSGPRQKPVGLEFTFGDRIDVRPVDLAQVEGLSDRLPLATRMVPLLRSGPMTLAALAEHLVAKVDSLSKVIRRDDHLFTKVTGSDGVTRIALVERRVA